MAYKHLLIVEAEKLSEIQRTTMTFTARKLAAEGVLFLVLEAPMKVAFAGDLPLLTHAELESCFISDDAFATAQRMEEKILEKLQEKTRRQ